MKRWLCVYHLTYWHARIVLSLWCYVYLNIFTFDHSYSCNYTPLWYITSQFTLLYYVVLLNITLKNVIWCYYLWLELILIWFILFYNLGFASLYTISRSIVRYERVNMWDNGHTAYHIQQYNQFISLQYSY